MTDKPTIGVRLMTLKERSGLSLAEIARQAGYQGASSVQKLFRKEYNPAQLQRSVAEKLAHAFAGKGDPAIRKDEVYVLAGEGDGFAQAFAEVSHYSYQASAFVGLHRTKRINEVVSTDSGYEVPLFVREDMTGGIPYHPCPEHLRARGIVGMYLTIGNMWPRYEEGEPVLYEHKNPPRAGDDVVVTLIAESHLDGGMVIGRLALLHDQEVQLDQLSPKGRITIPRADVISVRRILHPTDLLMPISYAKGD